MFLKVAPKFSELIGATEAREALAQTSVTFLQSLGDASGSNEVFQKQLANLYHQMASALGNPYAANTIGDYTNALRFAEQSLAIVQNLQKQHPNDEELLKQLVESQDTIGSILGVLGRPEEALEHHRLSLQALQQFLDLHPGDDHARTREVTANFRLGSDLMDLGRAQEALEKHYLPFGKPWLERTEEATISSDEAHQCVVAHQLVGRAEMALNRAADAMAQFQQAQNWAKLLVDREPNEARYVRDWSGGFGIIGNAQIALGRYDEGLTNLQMTVHLAETIVARDPMNGSSQEMLIWSLQELAGGFAKVASDPATLPARQSELWQQAVESLTRCEGMLASPQFERIKPHLSMAAREIKQNLDEARNALQKIAGEAGTKP